MGASECENNASSVPLPGSQPNAFDGERTKIETTNHQSQESEKGVSPSFHAF